MADYWIVTRYNYKHQPSLEIAMVERDRLAASDIRGSFRVVRCKTNQFPSTAGLVIDVMRSALSECVASGQLTDALKATALNAISEADKRAHERYTEAVEARAAA